MTHTETLDEISVKPGVQTPEEFDSLLEMLGKFKGRRVEIRPTVEGLKPNGVPYIKIKPVKG